MSVEKLKIGKRYHHRKKMTSSGCRDDADLGHVEIELFKQLLSLDLGANIFGAEIIEKEKTEE